jgi:hypothetical protein
MLDPKTIDGDNDSSCVGSATRIINPIVLYPRQEPESFVTLCDLKPSGDDKYGPRQSTLGYSSMIIFSLNVCLGQHPIRRHAPRHSE